MTKFYAKLARHIVIKDNMTAEGDKVDNTSPIDKGKLPKKVRH